MIRSLQKAWWEAHVKVCFVKPIDRIYGLAGNDVLIGKDGDDRLEAGQGEGTLYGGASDGSDDDARDMLMGGAGSDTYFVGDGDRPLGDGAQRVTATIFCAALATCSVIRDYISHGRLQ